MTMTERQQTRTSGLTAITLERSRVLEADVEEVYAILADPNGLAQLLPRVTRLRMRHTGPNSADLTTWMRFPVVGEVRTEGVLTWREPYEIIYQSRSTLPVVARWSIESLGPKVLVTTNLNLDLVPLLGPMALFVPEKAVKDVMASELDRALDAIAVQLAQTIQQR